MRSPERWPSKERTSHGIFIRRGSREAVPARSQAEKCSIAAQTYIAVKESAIEDQGQGEKSTAKSQDPGKLDLRDVLVIETTDNQRLEFEVVGLVEDEDSNAYAICYSEETDDFVVTDEYGKLVEDEELSREILDDFFVLAEEAEGEEEEQTEEGS